MPNMMYQQAVEDAANDMATVQAAAEAISAAISKVKPWLNGDTWTGSAATAWEGEWNSFYATVTRCLNELPNAEASVISSTQTQMKNLEAKEAKASAA